MSFKTPTVSQKGRRKLEETLPGFENRISEYFGVQNLWTVPHALESGSSVTSGSPLLSVCLWVRSS